MDANTDRRPLNLPTSPDAVAGVGLEPIQSAGSIAVLPAANIEEKGRDRDNDRASRFVARYQDLVINTCYAFLRNIDDAHDVAQEVFLTALRHGPSIATEGEWRAWLYRVASRRSLNVVRKQKRRRWLSFFRERRADVNMDLRSLGSDGELLGNDGELRRNDGEPHEYDLADIAAPERARPDLAFESTELSACLEAAIAALPDRQRIAFTLHRHEELTNTEIGAILAINANAVDALLHRARLRLRKHLAAQYRDLTRQ